MNPLSNIKKIRGWKRRIAEAARWKGSHRLVNLDHLERYGYATAQIRFHPWGNLIRRESPFWYRRILLKHLVTIHDEWAVTLSREFGANFYLRLWLFHPRFHESQVVAAIGKRIEYYESVFRPEHGLKASPPPQYMAPDYKLTRFEWTPCVDEDRYSVDEGDIDPDDVGWLLKEGAVRERSPSGTETYVIRRGALWVGGLKS